VRSLEEELRDKKLDIDNLEAPEELGGRLSAALDSVEETNNKSFKNIWIIRHKIIAAVLAFIVFLGVYNYDVFAYYGKKILGYDEVAVGSLKELNELGKGQEINKSYKFKNGAEIILDGVILDDNKLVTMYRIKGISEGLISEFSVQDIKGGLISSYRPHGGSGKISDDKKAVSWVMDFETPRVFDKNLTFNIICWAKGVSYGEKGKISFKLDRNKAIKRMVKCNVNQTVEFQGIKYNFKTLSASSLSVMLEGNITVNSEKDKKLFFPDTPSFRGSMRTLKVELWETYIKDGETVTKRIDNSGFNMGSGIDGINFKYEFDGLKANLQKLILKAVKTEDMKEIDRTIYVNSQTRDVKVVPETEELIIRDVKEQDGNTVVTFVSEKDIAFGTALDIDGMQAKTLEETSKIVRINGKECLEKIYKFEGCGKKMSMLFKEITHETYINKQITIYENK